MLSRHCRFLLPAVAAVGMLATTARAQNNLSQDLGYRDWKPLPAADDPTLKAPVVEPDADAEALFWEVHAYDEYSGRDYSVEDHYVRLKIFTERGREAYSKVDLPFGPWQYVSDVRARVVRPDGSIVEIKGDDVFERVVSKKHGRAYSVKSFAVPALQVGSLLEYQWRKRTNFIRFDVDYDLQMPVPVRELRYFIKPLVRDWFGATMNVRAFHATLPRWDEDHKGFHSIVIKNVPAFRPEPQTPPEHEIRPWMLVYYSQNTFTKPDKFWKDYGKHLYDWYKSSLVPSPAVTAKAKEIVGDAPTPAEKLHRLYEYCRSEIRKNEDYDYSLSEEEYAHDKKTHQSADQTIELKHGSNRDINTLFGALAAASGFEVRMAAASNREEAFLDDSFSNDYSLSDHVVAVRDGEAWRFFDPASSYMPAGMLRWRNEGMKLMLGDPATPGFVESSVSGPAKSLVKSEAKLRLAEDGAIDGDVRREYSGHPAFDQRDTYGELSPTDQVEKITEDLRKTVVGDVSDARVENMTDVDKPLVVAYHVHLPTYAQRAGQRLLFAPSFFERGRTPRFSASERLHPVSFRYPWSEEDRVSIEMPPGYALDNPQTPAPISGGAAADYKVKLMLARNPYTLIYERKFSFGGDGALLYGKESYPVLKQLFDMIARADDLSLAVKPSATTAAAAAKP